MHSLCYSEADGNMIQDLIQIIIKIISTGRERRSDIARPVIINRINMFLQTRINMQQQTDYDSPKTRAYLRLFHFVEYNAQS